MPSSGLRRRPGDRVVIAMNEISDGSVSGAIRRRRMVRAFSPRPLETDFVVGLLETARRAPSAGNCQAAGFVLLDSPSLTARYWDTTLPPDRRAGFRWQRLLDAPVLVLVTSEPDCYPERYRESDKAASGLTSLDRWPVPYWWVDAGAVVQNLLLLAVENSLGACLFGPFEHEAALMDEFGLPDGLRLVATIALGYPMADEPGRSAGRPRRPLNDLVIRPSDL